MTIVIEGMDNTGKTTLAKKLSVQFNLEYLHSEKPVDKEEGEKNMLALCMAGKVRIRDRINAISELVYGSTIKGKSRMHGVQWAWIDLIMKSGVLLIYCRPPSKTILKFGDREQMDGVIEHSSALLRTYDWVFHTLSGMYPGKIVYYDYTGRPLRLKYYGMESIQRRVASHLNVRGSLMEKVNYLETHWKTRFEEEWKDAIL